jgi:hypothetical protein
MSYKTIFESTGVRQKFWGVVTSPELLYSLTDAHDDGRFNSLRYVIKDYLDVEFFDVGFDLPDFFGPLIPGKRLPVSWLKYKVS